MDNIAPGSNACQVSRPTTMMTTQYLKSRPGRLRALKYLHLLHVTSQSGGSPSHNGNGTIQACASSVLVYSIHIVVADCL
jgi:hypothetical protein